MEQQGIAYQSNFLRVHNNKIHYLMAGEGEPVMLIHGTPTSSAIWRNIIPVLASDYMVMAPDMLGYGKSDKPQNADVSISAQADMMVEFLNQANSGSVAVVGHGTGGAVAQVMAVRYPERISRMVLINAACYSAWLTAELRALQKPNLDKKLSVEKLETILKKDLPKGVFHKDQMSDGVFSELMEPWSTPWGLGAFLQDVRALDSRDTEEISRDLKRLDIPVLILWGRHDPWYKVRLAERLHRDIKVSQLEIIPDAGHFVMEDQPARVGNAILKFLRASAIARTPQLEPVSV